VALLDGPGGAEALISQTIEETRAAGGTGLVAATPSAPPWPSQRPKANIASPAPIHRNAGFHSVASERRYALKMAAQASPRA
jgi:hypothetical protein